MNIDLMLKTRSCTTHSARSMYTRIYTYTHVTSIRVEHSPGVEDAVLHHAQRVSLSLRGSNVSASPRHAVPDLLAFTPCAPYSNTLATHAQHLSVMLSPISSLSLRAPLQHHISNTLATHAQHLGVMLSSISSFSLLALPILYRSNTLATH